MAQLEDARMAVAGALVEDRLFGERCVEVFHARARPHLEGVDAAAAHEQPLVAQHVADGADLALVAKALAQQARVGVAASVPELGKLEFDKREVMDVCGNRVGALA